MPNPLIRKKLTVKQQKFVKKYVESGKVATAAANAGYGSPGYGSYLKAQPNIQNAIERAMTKAGITEDLVGQTIKEGLGSTTPKLYDKSGMNIIRGEHPDFHVRKEYVDIVLKVKGAYAPERRETLDRRFVINVNLDTLKGMAEADVLDAEEVKEIKELEAHPENTEE